MNFLPNFFASVFIGGIFLVASCGNDTKEEAPQTKPSSAVTAETAATYEVKTFESADESGNKKGWGYDLYINGNKTIHQPTIPAVAGIRYFKSEEEAKRVGTFAMNKMKTSGNFPTLSIEELNSLGITN